MAQGPPPLLDAEIMVGDDQILVEHQLLAQAVTGRAGALRRVEREEAGLDLGNGEAADGAGELLGKDDAVVGDAGALELAAGGVELGARLLDAGAGDLGHGRVHEIHIGQPSASLSAVSKLSARRVPISSRTTRRSITTSMSCLYFLSRAGASSIR